MTEETASSLPSAGQAAPASPTAQHEQITAEDYVQSLLVGDHLWVLVNKLI